MADDSTRWGITEPDADRSDPADVPLYVRNIVAKLEALGVQFGQGPLAGRPVSTVGAPGIAGRFYVATDQNPMLTYYDYGTGWTQVALPDSTIAGDILKVGTLALRPAASAATNMYYFVTDVNGGTLYQSDGASWNQRTAGLTATATPADGSVTTAKLAANAVTSAKIDETTVATVPVGGVLDWPWASGSIPPWAGLPGGQPVARATYPVLAALDTASGTPHGVSGGNIVLPDYRGRVGVGKDDMANVAANRITVAVSGINGTVLGAVGGAQGVSLSIGQLPAHNFTVTGAPGFSDPQHLHGVMHGANAGSSGTLQGINADHEEGPGGAHTTSVSTGIVTSVGTLGTASQGSGSAHQNVQPTIVVNKIIRLV